MRIDYQIGARRSDGTVELWAQPADAKGKLLAVSEIPAAHEKGSLRASLDSQGPLLLRALVRARGQVDISPLQKLLITTGPPEVPKPAPGVPNIVVVLIDALRADAVGADGGPSTPTIDRLAEHGRVYDRAYSAASWTRPGVASLFTGLTTTAHRVSDDDRELPEEAATLAERLRLLGYDTAAVTANRQIDAAFHFDQGFRQYEVPRPHQTYDRTKEFDPNHRDVRNTADEVYDLALKEVGLRESGRPLLLYVHTVETHAPYQPAKWLLNVPKPDILVNSFLIRRINREGARPGELKAIKTLYRGSALYADEALGRFLARLGKKMDLNRTLVVLTADHGESFLEHGVFTHRVSLYEPEIRVPLIIAGPGVPVGHSGNLVSLVDLLPTLVQAGGGGPVDTMGFPLQREWAGTPLGRDVVVSELQYGDDLKRAFVGKDRKLVSTPGAGLRLFDLGDEAITDAAARARLAKAARERMVLAKQLRLPDTFVRESLPPAVIANLKALGYVN